MAIKSSNLKLWSWWLADTWSNPITWFNGWTWFIAWTWASAWIWINTWASLNLWWSNKNNKTSVWFSYKATPIESTVKDVTYNKDYPWFDKDDYERLERMASKSWLTWQKKKDLMDELYMQYYPQVINKHKLDDRQQIIKEEAYSTKDYEWDDKKQQETRVKLADLSQKAKKKYWIDASANDEDVINDMTNSIPNGWELLENYINNWDKEYLYAAWLETWLEKAEDVAVWALQSWGKWWYNLMGQRVDRLGKKIADKLEGTSVAEWIQKKAIEEFGEDAVKEFWEEKQKQLEEGTAFKGRTQTDITKPILWETRSNNWYTKAWELIWDIASWIAVSAPLAAATAPMYAASTLWGAATLWALEWAVGAWVSKLWSTWEWPDLKDLAIWGITWIAWGLFSRYLQNLPKNQQEGFRKEAETYINKSIKPTVKGKVNQADYDKFVDDTLDVANLMNKNKDLLEYTDDVWEKVTWKMPTNLRETSEALWNLKKKLYDAYNDIAKQAWDKGARVDMNKAYNQLDDLLSDTSQNIANPQTESIVNNFKKQLLQYTDDAGTISIEDAQKITQDFNQQLKAFFRNPNGNDVSKSAIIAKLNKWTKDAINESIDDVLDESIDAWSKSSQYYSQLKQMYGKILNIEDEISKRALVDARKNAKWLSQTVLDALAGWEATDALLTIDPAKLWKAAVMKAISKYYKYVNDPNVQINNLFKLVENGWEKSLIWKATDAVVQTVNNAWKSIVKPNVIEAEIAAWRNAMNNKKQE